MKYVFITDTHAGVRNNSPIFFDYMGKFYDEIFFPYIRKHDIRVIFHLGDIVDKRQGIAFTTMKFLQENYLNRLGKINHIPLVGNHDIPLRTTNEINALGVLGKSNPVEEPTFMKLGPCSFVLIPWIHKNNYEECMNFVKDNDADFCLMHPEFEGFEMHRGTTNKHGMSVKPFKKFKRVLCGHFHLPSKKGNIQYLGSPFEMTWNDYGEKRGFWVYDSDTEKLEMIENPYKLFCVIEYPEKKKVDCTGKYVKIIVREKDSAAAFEKFVESVYERGPINVQIVDQTEIFQDVEDFEVLETKDTFTILNDYLSETIDEKHVGRVQELASDVFKEAMDRL